MPDCHWKVIHRFSEGVKVKNPVPAYESLEVTLRYEGDRLVEIEHDLRCDDQSHPYQVLDCSREQLKLFWELLQYWYGVPLPNLSSHVTKFKSATSLPVTNTGFSPVCIDALLSGPIVMPAPAVFTKGSSRLFVWLRLANEASVSCDADAIRNYFMVWEDWHSQHKSGDVSPEATNLRLTRHFVSHGGKLNKRVSDFVSDALKTRTERFDPTDAAQQGFVHYQRESARCLIESLIKTELRTIVSSTSG